MLQDFHLSYISFLSDPLICRLAAFIPCVRICSSQYCSIHLRFWLKIHTSFSLHPFAVSSLQKFHIPLAKNYHAEVYPFSREVTFKPLSSSLQRGGEGGIRFLRNPLPAYHSAFLTIGLPVLRKTGNIRAYQVPYK